MAKISNDFTNKNINSAMVNTHTVGAAGQQRLAFFMPTVADRLKCDYTATGEAWKLEIAEQIEADNRERAAKRKLVADITSGDMFPGGFTHAYLERLARITPPSNTGGFLPKEGTPFFGKTRAAIAFDWCSSSVKLLPGFFDKKRALVKVKETKLDGHYELLIGNEKKAELTFLKGNNQENWATLKLDNRQLYQPGEQIIKLILDICEDMGLKWMWFSRLDVAIDMQRTDIKGVGMQDLFDKIGKGQYIFKSKTTANLVGTPTGETDGETLELRDVYRRCGQVQTIYVGRRNSGFNFCMYNKSVQMRKGNFKPWVAEHWKNAGFDGNFDTFRIEFSHLKGTQKLLHVNDAGELLDDGLRHDNIDIINQLDKYAEVLYTKHFQLAAYKKGERFSRMKPVNVLTDFTTQAVYSQRITEKQPSTNIVKNRIKWLAQHAAAAWEGGRKLNACENFKTVLAVVEAHGLDEWFSSQANKLKINSCITLVRTWLGENDYFQS